MAEPDDTSPPRQSDETLPEGSLSRLLRYELDRSVGTGGTGDVLVAHDKLLHRRVALKHLHPAYATRGGVARAFVKEARLAGRLDHPNMVPVHDLGLDTDGRAWFTMKLVEGRTLGARIRERGTADPDAPFLQEVVEILLKVCDGLAFAHSRGVVHCDVKPSNLMLGHFGEVYVMDWGIARTLPAPASEQGLVAGTPGFMAPEQARGELHRVDARTDVHGVGATLYYAITGKAPYAGPDTPARVDATRRGIVQPPGERVAGRYLPAGLCAIAMKALAAEPADRYPSMVALRDALHRFLAGGWWFAPEHFAAGSVVVREGDAGGAAYIVESGTAEVRCRGEFIRRIGPGDVFGETAVLTAGTRTATVTAITDVDVLVVSREALEAELGRDTWLARFVRTLAVRFRELHERHYPVP